MFILEDNKFSKNQPGPLPIKVNAKVPESKLWLLSLDGRNISRMFQKHFAINSLAK